VIRRFFSSYPTSSAIFFLFATLVMTWPMALAPGAHYSGRQDFYMNVWNLWWVARAFTESGVALFHTPLLHFPDGAGLEVQPLSLAQSIPAIPLTLALGPVKAFNLLVMLSFWFAGWSASLWTREVAGRNEAGLVGGAIFAFAPYHYTYFAQLNLVCVGFIPLYLLAALHLGRKPTAARATLAGVALAAVGLGSWYYGVIVGMVAVVLSAVRLFGGPRESRQARAGIEALHWVSCLILLAPVVARILPSFVGAEYLEAPATSGMGLLMERFKHTWATMSLWSYAGLVTLSLAAFGAVAWRRSRALVGMVAFFFVLSLGARLTLGPVSVPMPYALLEKFPVLDAMRYYDRFFVLCQLGLAALAALGVSRVLDRVEERRASWKPAVAAVLLILPLAEFWPGGLPSTTVDVTLPVPVERAGDEGAVMAIPTYFKHWDGEMMFHQVRHRRPVVGAFITRRDRALPRRFREDSAIGPLLGKPPSSLGGDLSVQLGREGFSHVYVQRRPLANGTPPEVHGVYGPLSIFGRTYLRQRLFPTYPSHADMAERSAAWEEALRPILGPAVAENSLASVFRVPREEP
jgi:hypothetical protein